MTTKKCTECGEVKDVDQFSKNRDGKNGPILHPACKVCRSARAMRWFNDNRERADANRRAWHIKKLYGITIDEYDSLLASQGGVCAICEKSGDQVHGTTGRAFSLSVDHDHETGHVRGILCNNCNRALGLFGDSAELLKSGIRYLERI